MKTRKATLAPLIKRYVDELGTLLVCRGEIGIDVTVLDVRFVYGRYEFLVEPLHGIGTTWVAREKVTF